MVRLVNHHIAGDCSHDCLECVHTAIRNTSLSGKPPRGWYYGKAFTKNDARSRGLIARVFKEENIPLLYYSDYYGDDLPYW